MSVNEVSGTADLTVDLSLDVRVKQGVALLDEKCPGWEFRVDLEALHMGDECRCVLGQLYCEYIEGRDALSLSQDDAMEHGFDVPRSPRYAYESEYRKLTRAWAAAVEGRRAEVVSHPGERMDHTDTTGEAREPRQWSYQVPAP